MDVERWPKIFGNSGIEIFCNKIRCLPTKTNKLKYYTTVINVSGSNREARFVTYVTTQTALVTATVTQTTTPLQVATIFFTSLAASQCFPLGLMASAGIQAC